VVAHAGGRVYRANGQIFVYGANALIALEVAPLAMEYSIKDDVAPVLLAEDSHCGPRSMARWPRAMRSRRLIGCAIARVPK
jgi:hypothetical protein